MREREILRRLCCFAGFLPHLSWALVAKRKWAFIKSLLLIHDFIIHICSIILIFYTSLSSSFPRHTISILHNSTQCKRQHGSFAYASKGVGLSFCKPPGWNLLGKVCTLERTQFKILIPHPTCLVTKTPKGVSILKKNTLWLGP